VIPFWLNIPLLTWLCLRGRARCCGQKIPAKYFAIELLTAVLFVTMYRLLPLSHFIIGSIFCSLLLVIAFIDMATMEVYEAMVIGGICVGIIVSLIVPQWHGEQFRINSMLQSIFGICFGSGLIFWIAKIGEMIFKKESMGIGDIQVIGMIGAFIGWKGCLYAIFGGCLISVVFLLPLLVGLKIKKGANFVLPREVPFVPFLAVGSIAYVLYPQSLNIFL
jgi:leader peptidase (prepilin peptidase)/N-methyltransferase